MEWTTFVDCPFDVSWTVGTESGNAITVAAQLKDFAGNDLTVPASLLMYLASDSAGLNIKSSTVTTETAIGTDGSLAVLLAGQVYQVTSEADGDIDISISTGGATTVLANKLLDHIFGNTTYTQLLLVTQFSLT